MQKLVKVFGKPGQTLWQRAHGIDITPVIPYEEAEEISRKKVFQNDTIDMGLLRQQLTAMIMDMAFELRGMRKVTSCIRLSLTYSDSETVDKQSVIAHTAMDDMLIGKSHLLLDSLYSKRKLIRVIVLKFSKLISGFEQIEMFDVPGERYNLYQSMDYIRGRFGNDAITLANLI